MINEPIYFWKIRTDAPYFEASLYKLETTEQQRHNMLKNINIKKVDDKIYIAPKANNNSKDVENYLAWNKGDKDGYDGLKKAGCIYKGELNMTLEEAETILASKKYNL